MLPSVLFPATVPCRAETVDHSKCEVSFCAADPAGDIKDHRPQIVRCGAAAVGYSGFGTPLCAEHIKVLG